MQPEPSEPQNPNPASSPEPAAPVISPPARSHRKVWIVILVVVLLVGAGLAWWLTRPGKKTPTKQASTTKPVVEAPPDTSTPSVNANVVLSGRAYVWDMEFIPSGEMLFTERNSGAISVFDTKKNSVSELTKIPDVLSQGEGGLMGLAVDPQFKKNRYIYTCYSSTAPDIRIVRWHVANDLKSVSDRKDLITGITYNTTTFPGRHSGCRVGFGPDGYLWAGTGDTAQGDTGQQPMALGGKILRVDRDGKAAPGNIGSGFDPRVYSYGHRNVQGLAFFDKPKDGVPGVSIEHGSDVDDEVNELKKGNFGWAPPAQGYDETVPMTDLKRFPDAIQAIWSSGSPTQAPSGATFIHGKQWKGWDGALAVAMLKAQHLKILRLDAKNKVIQEEKTLIDTYGRLRDVAQGPDGSLYVSTSNGDDKIIKLTPGP